MDWTPLVDASITAAAGMITVCAPIATAYVASHLRNKQLAALTAGAVTVGAGIAHDALTTAVAQGAPDWAAAKHLAVARGLAAAKQIADQVTAEDVTAGLSGLLAADPTVPAGVAAVATAIGAEPLIPVAGFAEAPGAPAAVSVVNDPAAIAIKTASDHHPPRVSGFDDAATRLLKG